jgi:two-component system sensor histidine kinase UhpB
LKHSRARTVNVALSRHNGELSLMVSDNGVGFSSRRRKNRGIGLQLMQHRASAVGGKLDIHSKPGRGVTVSCVVPMKY